MTREYPTVLKRSKNPELLLAAHAVVITEAQAIKIIYTYADEHEVKVDFTGKVNGRCWVGKQCRITLPPTGSEYLTAGMAIHELAHVINHLDKNGKAHDDAFVRVLDMLIKSENAWKKENK